MIRKLLASLAMLTLALGLTACHSTPDVPQAANQIDPLLIGAQVPGVPLRTASGEAVTIPELAGQRPAVLVFYRGGWCPYCTKHLQDLGRVEAQLRDLGYQVLAVSPDLPEKLQDTASQQELGYTLLSDSQMQLAQEMGIAFQVDDQTLDKYKTYDIDLEAWSGQSHHWLPVPSIFLVDREGTIAFSYVNPDYSVRLSGDTILAAAKELAQQ